MTTIGSPARTCRSATATAVTITAGAAGHLIGHGTVSLAGLLITALPIALAAWVLTARECTLAMIAGATFSGQLAVHVLLSTLSGMPADGARMSGSSMDGALSMFLGHALAAVVVAWWLRRGERRIWTALRRAATAARRLGLLLGSSPRPPACPAQRRLPASPAAPWRLLASLRHAVVLRGPPSFA
jgi:hypothetical protein